MRTRTQSELDSYAGANACLRSFRKVHDNIRLIWRTKCYSWFCKISAVLCAIASAMILWSEVTMTTDSLESPVGVILTQLSDGGAGIFIVQVFAFLALAYMSICTYWAMFRMNLGWAFTLQPNQQSPATSLLFNANYLCRLQFSLAFNFLLLINKKERYENLNAISFLIFL